MFKKRISGVAAAVNQVFDRKVAIGAALGISVAFAGYAVSAPGFGNTLVSTSSELISQQSSVVAENIKADAEDCASGSKDGTIGYSIKQALEIHTELASATPNVEALFDVGSDCFSSISQIFDLSFAIPSLASIISAAQSAVLQYAQKKICTAVNQVTSMVTTPINNAIGKINGVISMADLNGLTNGLVQQGISQIDPNLGSQYHPSVTAGTYTVGTNPFNATQTDFGGGTSAGGGTGTAGGNTGTGTTNGGTDVNAQINTLNQQIADVQAQVGPAQYQVQQAQQRLAGCFSSGAADCGTYQQAVINAQAVLTGLNSQLSSLQGQLGNISGSGSASAGMQRSPQRAAAQKSGGFIESVGNLFN